MELLTEPQLGALAFGVAKLAFVAGLAGALTALGILRGVYAVAGFFAKRTVKAARIRAARSRATTAPVAVEKPGAFCHERGHLHVYDGAVCAVCGWHDQTGI